MATLTSPITKLNVVARFADYVRDTANAGIIWGTNALPFPEFLGTPTVPLNAGVLGGTISGRSLGITGASLTGTTINARTIYTVLLAETLAFSRIRLMRAVKNVTGGATDNFTFDQTRVTHMSASYQASDIVTENNTDPSNVTRGSSATATGLEVLFDNMKKTYNLARSTSAGTFRVDVCHTSCHSACHASRSRR